VAHRFVASSRVLSITPHNPQGHTIPPFNDTHTMMRRLMRSAAFGCAAAVGSLRGAALSGVPSVRPTIAAPHFSPAGASWRLGSHAVPRQERKRTASEASATADGTPKVEPAARFLSKNGYRIFAPDRLSELAMGIVQGHVIGVPYVLRTEAEALLRMHLDEKPNSGGRYHLLRNTGPRGSGKTTLLAANMIGSCSLNSDS
jgi:hypothetical protein